MDISTLMACWTKWPQPQGHKSLGDNHYIRHSIMFASIGILIGFKF